MLVLLRLKRIAVLFLRLSSFLDRYPLPDTTSILTGPELLSPQVSQNGTGLSMRIKIGQLNEVPRYNTILWMA